MMLLLGQKHNHVNAPKILRSKKDHHTIVCLSMVQQYRLYMCLPRVHISPVYVRYDEVKAFGIVSLPNINIISQEIPQTC